MTSADGPATGEPAARPASRRRREGGFTLVEMLLAFAILAITMAYLIQSQTSALRMGAKARDLRDIRVMSDTVFRKALYEIWQWQDGASSTADNWYGEFAHLKGPQRDQWKTFRLIFHKQKRMAAGNDPTGKVESMDSGASNSNSGGSSTTGSTSKTTTPKTTGSGTTSGTSGTTPGSTDAEPSSGEPVYVVWLEVFTDENTEAPELTLRTIVPVPEIELEQDK